MLSVFRCPSSNVPEFFNRGGAAASMMVDSYTGIAGSVILLPTPPGPPPNQYAVGCCNGSGPLATDNGIFFAGSKTGLAYITDGTSNTWMIGEQSAHLKDANRQPVTAGYTAGCGHSGGLYGWTMGAAHANNGTQAGWGDGRHFNCTSVRWKINAIGLTNSASTGTNNDVGTNFPLSSNHPGGINVALGDASVRFVSDTTPELLISAFCTKSNNEAVSSD